VSTPRTTTRLQRYYRFLTFLLPYLEYFIDPISLRGARRLLGNTG
jgi:hypothetical protein